MRRLVSAVLVVALAAASLATALSAQAPASPRLDALMSEHDRRETGVAKMTPTERQALERWLARYTAAAVAGATRATEEGVAAAPRAAPARTNAPARRAQRVVVGATVEIVSVLSNGGFLVMEDGSMWEVYVSDITGTTTWTVGDRVLVRDHPAPPDRLYRLRFENGRARSTASVRYAGKAGPARASSDSARSEGLRSETIFRAGEVGIIPVVPILPGGVEQIERATEFDRYPAAVLDHQVGAPLAVFLNATQPVVYAPVFHPVGGVAHDRLGFKRSAAVRTTITPSPVPTLSPTPYASLMPPRHLAEPSRSVAAPRR